MQIPVRLRQSLPVAALHLVVGALIACMVAIVIFWIWYPYPYDEFSGGRKLFLLLIGVDLVCGPLLTLLLFTKSKSRKLLLIDLSLILAIQIGAMVYGIMSVWQARPVYLVAEIDRLKVVTQADINGIDKAILAELPKELRTSVWHRPLVVGIREPQSVEEKNKVMFESVQGGRDYADRPEFYTVYGELSARKSLDKGRFLINFLNKYPDLRLDLERYASAKNRSLDKIKYLPVIARQDWIAILDEKGYVDMFMKGDGF